jgi:hypothetical protein
MAICHGGVMIVVIPVAIMMVAISLVMLVLIFTIMVVVVTRVNSTNVLYEGLRIGGIGRRMNSKVKSVKQGVYQK